MTLKINKNFRKFIHQALTSSKRIKHTHHIIGSNLIINSEDLEQVDKIFERLELRYKIR
jgi:hypothetical protein